MKQLMLSVQHQGGRFLLIFLTGTKESILVVYDTLTIWQSKLKYVHIRPVSFENAVSEYEVLKRVVGDLVHPEISE